jgi:DNA replication protein DnaC
MLDQLHQLGLSGMAQAFAELEAFGEGATLTHADWLGLLVDREVTHRRDKRLAARLRYARLRHNAVVEDVDYRVHRGLDRALFHKLAAGDWVDAHDNLILCGPTGVGKSWLACALGHKACRDNRSVLYQRVPKLFADLALARGDGRYARIMRSLNGAQLLILDDWGLDPLDAGARRDLYEILEERYGRRSTILTSRSPSINGTRSSATQPTPTPSSTASSTTPIASISPATACAEPVRDPPQRIDQHPAYRSKTNYQQDALKRATSCRNSERHDLGMTERHRRNR